jgi:hypothetical protein
MLQHIQTTRPPNTWHPQGTQVPHLSIYTTRQTNKPTNQQIYQKMSPPCPPPQTPRYDAVVLVPWPYSVNAFGLHFWVRGYDQDEVSLSLSPKGEISWVRSFFHRIFIKSSSTRYVSRPTLKVRWHFFDLYLPSPKSFEKTLRPKLQHLHTTRHPKFRFNLCTVRLARPILVWQAIKLDFDSPKSLLEHGIASL